ncbi:MAG: DUF4347 domain-containing protein [Leptolyngbyaceae cyanobacterium SL_5_9]|nr:DUF4347 domain-containing protein [Leptolyngbyaceae cyanobacterium SL_5_9]
MSLSNTLSTVQNLILAHTSAAAKKSTVAPLSSSVSVSSGHQLVFVDAAIQNYMNLAAGAIPGAEVIILHPNEDGVTQISLALAGRTRVSGIHLVAHGSPGSLRLGNTQLSLDTLGQYQVQLQQWRNALGKTAELLIYGCRVADGTAGIAFIQTLKSLLGVEVAASSTPVGNATQGGNWNLDARTGDMTAALAFSREAIAPIPPSWKTKPPFSLMKTFPMLAAAQHPKAGRLTSSKAILKLTSGDLTTLATGALWVYQPPLPSTTVTHSRMMVSKRILRLNLLYSMPQIQKAFS